MIYKPKKGQIKDCAIYYKDGKYYLFSMYHKENSNEFNNVWLAISRDGVNFSDYGCVVEDFPAPVWAMKVYAIDDGFMMNSGSFGADGNQSVLKFWYSKDLINWEYKEELDVISPKIHGKNIRLDCMYVIHENSKYYGYATGQFGYLTSDDGVHWSAYPQRIDYAPLPPYNVALGGFEVADCIKFNDKYYMFCGGFGHLGYNGYGVYIYKSDTPDGIFKPHLPNYRINGTSKRWVNIWERFFEAEGEILANNYTYDGYSYENGNVWLPPIKKLASDEMGLHLEWWQGNQKMIGKMYASQDELIANNGKALVFDQSGDSLAVSETIPIKENTVAEFQLVLEENDFIEYSSGGFYLKENETEGTAVVFDTYGKTSIFAVREGKKVVLDDEIAFGSTAPYWLEGGKTYHVRLLIRGGMYEIYIDDKYLQTLNTTHYKERQGKSICGIAALSERKECRLKNIKLYNLDIK